MINENRLVRIESSLTPKQAVLLWLREEHQGKTSDEYLRWMMQRPPSAAPRTRVERQVVEAIRVAMKGQDPGSVEQAVRQAQMHADLLILLVNRTNWVILEGNEARSLRTALLYEMLRNAALSDEDESEAVNKWADCLRLFATDFLSLQATIGLIRNRYFDGQSILLKDAEQSLEQTAKSLRNMITAYDRVVSRAELPDLAIDNDRFHQAINEKAAAKADYIFALAKSKMLEDFGQPEAADAVLKPYICQN